MKFSFLSLFLFFLGLNPILGQTEDEIIRCNTDAYHESLMEDPEYAAAWHERFARTKLELQNMQDSPKADCMEVMYVPVAVHYIGVGIDLACATDKALDQITRLNADFGGTNADLTSWTNHQPATWPGVQSKGTCIEFCLATLNHPDGSGIPEGDFAITINEYPEGTNNLPEWANYLNFVVSGYDMGGVLGTSPLGGMGNGDVILISLSAWSAISCGGSTINPTYNQGRTATHEAGHYFGLMHPFSGDCTVDGDAPLVNDTPITGEATYGCPDPGSEVITCDDPIVFPTYMEYCDDACLYMFTSDQADAIEAHYTANLNNFAENANVTCQDLACLNFDINFTSANESCSFGTDGSINITALNSNNPPVQFSINNGLSFQDHGNFGGLTAGKYYLVVEDAAGCSKVDSVEIVREKPTLNILSIQNSFCGDNGGAISVEVDHPGDFQYSLSGDVPWQNSSEFTGLSTGAYEVVVRNSADCTNRRTVIVGDDSDLNLVERRIRPVSCPLSDNGLIDTYLANGEPPFVYTLDNAQIKEQGFYDNLSPGRYVLNVRDSRGCQLEKAFNIGISYADIEDSCPCDVFIPNAMTPDGDGLNDIFKPVFNCPFTQYHLQVFNRFGNLIFETEDQTVPWNGGENEYYGNPGVYFYKLNYRWGEERNESLEVQTEQGFITVIR